MAINILLIDDNQDQVTITQRALRQAPEYVVEAAGDGASGLAQLRARRYDVVLCDYRLPGTTGVDVLKAMKAQGQDVPFVIVTAAGSERVAVEALQEGAYDYVVKDLTYDALLPGVLRSVLARHAEKQEREHLAVERDAALQALQEEQKALKTMNQIMLGREERILELKREVNALLAELRRPPKYTAG